MGWAVGDLAGAQSREDVGAATESANPDDSPGRRANHTGQVWACRGQIKPGDVVPS